MPLLEKKYNGSVLLLYEILPLVLYHASITHSTQLTVILISHLQICIPSTLHMLIVRHTLQLWT